MAQYRFQNFIKHTKAFYDSDLFKNKAKEADPFLQSLKPFLFGIPNDLKNIVRPFHVFAGQQSANPGVTLCSGTWVSDTDENLRPQGINNYLFFFF